MKVFGALWNVRYIFRLCNITLLLARGSSRGLRRRWHGLLLGCLACTSCYVGSLLSAIFGQMFIPLSDKRYHLMVEVVLNIAIVIDRCPDRCSLVRNGMILTDSAETKDR